MEKPAEIEGAAYSFTLRDFDADIVTISTDTEGDWIEAGANTIRSQTGMFCAR